MICPHCDYKQGYHWEDDNYIETIGKEGDLRKEIFWKHPLPMERNENKWTYENAKAGLYACPKCMKTFIED